MNLNDILKNFSSNDLQQINAFLNSSQGKKAASGLDNRAKQEILNQFMKLDSNQVKSKLNGISKEDILRLLK